MSLPVESTNEIEVGSFVHRYGNSWEKHGFTLVGDAVPVYLLDELSDEATSVIRKRYHEDSLLDLESALTFARCRALDQFIALLTDIFGSLPALRQLEESIAICVADLLLDLGKKLRQIKVGLFYNAQDSPETTYEWHQESSYYADEFVVTAWLPLFRPIALVDGPMLVIPGSHAKHLEFRSERQPGGFVSHIPLEIPEDSTIVACTLQRGAAVLFHPNLIHKSGVNVGQRPRIALVCRILTS